MPRLEGVGPAARARQRRRIDATGRVVGPGFIDIQSHSRYAFSGDGRVVSKVTQGITTEIMGEGSTNAPGPDFNGPRGFDAWLRAMRQHGASPNLGSFLGASSVRNWVMGMARGVPDEARLQQMRALVENAMNLCTLAGPEGVLILGFRNEANRRYTGMYLAEIAADMGVDWVDAVIDLVLAEEGGPGTIYFLMSEENVELQVARPWIKFGTDAAGRNPEGAVGLTHPRAYGTFPRILGRYVRERRVLSLEEAVRKASSAVATRLSIRDRGLLREGFFADVVVFDPQTVADRATYEQPHRVSIGIEWVLVNGTVVVEEGRHTGAMPGRIVRGPGYAVAGSDGRPLGAGQDSVPESP